MKTITLAIHTNIQNHLHGMWIEKGSLFSTVVAEIYTISVRFRANLYNHLNNYL